MRLEAEPIAKLLTAERTQIVGWVYLWNMSELSILWISDHRSVQHIDPPLNPKILAEAKRVSQDPVIGFLERLSSAGDNREM